MKSKTDSFKSVGGRYGYGPDARRKPQGMVPRPHRARSLARGGRVTDQGRWPLGQPTGHDIVIAPFTADHLERVRKALTLGFLVVEGIWHHDGLEPCNGEFVFDVKDLYLITRSAKKRR